MKNRSARIVLYEALVEVAVILFIVAIVIDIVIAAVLGGSVWVFVGLLVLSLEVISAILKRLAARYRRGQ